jgi:hypothetical protein
MPCDAGYGPGPEDDLDVERSSSEPLAKRAIVAKGDSADTLRAELNSGSERRKPYQQEIAETDSENTQAVADVVFTMAMLAPVWVPGLIPRRAKAAFALVSAPVARLLSKINFRRLNHRSGGGGERCAANSPSPNNNVESRRARIRRRLVKYFKPPVAAQQETNRRRRDGRVASRVVRGAADHGAAGA